MNYPLPPLVAKGLDELRGHVIEPTEKGFGSLASPAAGGPVSAATLAAARPPLHAAGFTYPLLTVRETALRNNIAAMAAYCARTGVALAPHGKTAMSPELAALQLAHGAWGITVATIGQLQTYRAFGFPRLLLANELVDEAGIAWLAAELRADPDFQAYCYVDSLDGVTILDQVLDRQRAGPQDRRLPVLVEIGHADGRTGCRTDEQALAVAKAANATGTLTVAGVAGYEGTIPGGSGKGGPGGWVPPDAGEHRVAAFCRRLRALADMVGEADHGTAELIVTAGGSAYFDVVTRELTAEGTAAVKVILRSGAYLAYDHGFYGTVSPAGRGAANAPALRPALELWAQVLSRPEPGLALVGAGRRDVGFDKGLPVPLRSVSAGGRRIFSGGRPPGIPPILGGNLSPRTPAAPPRPGGSLPPRAPAAPPRLGGNLPPRTTPTPRTASAPAPQTPPAPLTSALQGSRVTELNDQHAYLRLDERAELAPGDLVSMGISHPCTTLDKWRVLVLVDDDDRVVGAVHTFF